jgi:adenylate cyclase class IV
MGRGNKEPETNGELQTYGRKVRKQEDAESRKKVHEVGQNNFNTDQQEDTRYYSVPCQCNSHRIG